MASPSAKRMAYRGSFEFICDTAPPRFAGTVPDPPDPPRPWASPGDLLDIRQAISWPSRMAEELSDVGMDRLDG
jgi:hypothetical protein